MTKALKSKKTKAHIRYKLEPTEDYPKGRIIPGTTTITGNLGWNSGVLINWANRIGLQGINAHEYVDETADIGNLAHAMITNELIHKKTDLSDCTPNQIDAAHNSLCSWYEWLKGHEVGEVYFVEKPLISKRWEYGGTLDIYWLLDGKKTLTDIKTSGGIYAEHLIQVGGGYVQLLEENGYQVEATNIVNIPRTEDEEFDFRVLADTDKYWQTFECCLRLHSLHKRFK